MKLSIKFSIFSVVIFLYFLEINNLKKKIKEIDIYVLYRQFDTPVENFNLLQLIRYNYFLIIYF